MAEIPYTPANDLQFLHQDFVTILGVPTHVVTSGRWLDEPLPDNDPDHFLVLFIPGMLIQNKVF